MVHTMCDRTIGVWCGAVRALIVGLFVARVVFHGCIRNR